MSELLSDPTLWPVYAVLAVTVPAVVAAIVYVWRTGPEMVVTVTREYEDENQT